MEVRQRRKSVVEAVRSLDAFPKMSKTYLRTTRSGGTISLLTFAIMLYMVFAEFRYYMAAIKFRYEPDVAMDDKLPLHVDMVVAMPCIAVGPDVLDSTRSVIAGAETLKKTDTWWQMTPVQADYLRSAQKRNEYLRENYHGLKEQLLRTGYWSIISDFPETHPRPTEQPDSCRVRGSMVLHKVAGNFHITADRVLVIPSGHRIHLSGALLGASSNFSHRILRLQFGDASYGFVSPLEGYEMTSASENTMYQYFVDVVPTDIRGLLGTTHTYQYSVKEQSRVVDHVSGSHGVPGIFVRYEMSALKVIISEDHEPLVQFLVRLCAVCGGIYVTAGVLNAVVGWMVWVVCCRGGRKSRRGGGGGKVRSPDDPAEVTTVTPLSSVTTQSPPVSAARATLATPQRSVEVACTEGGGNTESIVASVQGNGNNVVGITAGSGSNHVASGGSAG